MTRSNAKYSRHRVTMQHIVYEKIACILVDVNSMVTSMVSTLYLRNIRECGSTLYVGMPRKQNGRPYNAM